MAELKYFSCYPVFGAGKTYLIFQNFQTKFADNTAEECNPKQWGSIECQCLEAHNQYRRQHNAPPLVMSKKLTKVAASWAKKLAAKDALQHSSNSTYGENLYFCNGCTTITGDMAVKPWYNEIEKYDYGKPEFSPTTGHFTQLVWKDTKEVGVGYAKKGKKFYLVCNYFPPGNVVGKYTQNVLPRISPD